MAKQTEKQQPFIWKKRRTKNITSEVVKEIRSKINSFSEVKGCTLHDSSQLSSDLANLESCFSQKQSEKISLFEVDYSSNFETVEKNKYGALCDTLHTDRCNTYREDVELTARSPYHGNRDSSRRNQFYQDEDVAVNTPAGWGSQDNSFYCYNGYTTSNATYNSSDFSTDNDVQSCTSVDASYGCSTVFFSKFTVDKEDYKSATNNSKQV